MSHGKVGQFGSNGLERLHAPLFQGDVKITSPGFRKSSLVLVAQGRAGNYVNNAPGPGDISDPGDSQPFYHSYALYLRLFHWMVHVAVCVRNGSPVQLLYEAVYDDNAHKQKKVARRYFFELTPELFATVRRHVAQLIFCNEEGKTSTKEMDEEGIGKVPLDLKDLTRCRYLEMCCDVVAVPRSTVITTAPTESAETLLTSHELFALSVLYSKTFVTMADGNSRFEINIHPDQRFTMNPFYNHEHEDNQYFPYPERAFRISDQTLLYYDKFMRLMFPDEQPMRISVDQELVTRRMRKLGFPQPDSLIMVLDRQVVDQVQDSRANLEAARRLLQAASNGGVAQYPYTIMAATKADQPCYMSRVVEGASITDTYHLQINILRKDAESRCEKLTTQVERLVWASTDGLQQLMRYVDPGNREYVPRAHIAYNEFLAEMPDIRNHPGIHLVCTNASPYLNSKLLWMEHCEYHFAFYSTHKVASIIRIVAVSACDVQEGVMSFNLVTNGEPGGGKTYCFYMIFKLMPDGTYVVLSRETNAVGTVNSIADCGSIQYQDEISGRNLGIASSASEAQKSDSVVSDGLQIEKERITTGRVVHSETRVNSTDPRKANEEVNGAPRHKHIVSAPGKYARLGSNQKALNKADPAVVSRYLVTSAGSAKRVDGTTMTAKMCNRMQAVESNGSTRQLDIIAKEKKATICYYRFAISLAYLLRHAVCLQVIPPPNKIIYNLYTQCMLQTLDSMGFSTRSNSRPMERMEMACFSEVYEFAAKRTWLDPDAPFYNKPFEDWQIFCTLPHMVVTEEMVLHTFGLMTLEEYTSPLRRIIINTLKSLFDNDETLWDPKYVDKRFEQLTPGQVCFDHCPRSQDRRRDPNYLFWPLEARVCNKVEGPKALASLIHERCRDQYVEFSFVVTALMKMTRVHVENPDHVTAEELKRYHDELYKYKNPHKVNNGGPAPQNPVGPPPVLRRRTKNEAPLDFDFDVNGRWGVLISKRFLFDSNKDLLQTCVESCWHDRTRMITPGREAKWLMRVQDHELLIEAFDLINEKALPASPSFVPRLYYEFAENEDQAQFEVTFGTDENDLNALETLAKRLTAAYPRHSAEQKEAIRQRFLHMVQINDLLIPERTLGLTTCQLPNKIALLTCKDGHRDVLMVSRLFIEFIIRTRREVSIGDSVEGYPHILRRVPVKKNRHYAVAVPRIDVESSKGNEVPKDLTAERRSVLDEWLTVEPLFETDPDNDVRQRFLKNYFTSEVLAAAPVLAKAWAIINDPLQTRVDFTLSPDVKTVVWPPESMFRAQAASNKSRTDVAPENVYNVSAFGETTPEETADMQAWHDQHKAFLDQLKARHGLLPAEAAECAPPVLQKGEDEDVMDVDQPRRPPPPPPIALRGEVMRDVLRRHIRTNEEEERRNKFTETTKGFYGFKSKTFNEALTALFPPAA